MKLVGAFILIIVAICIAGVSAFVGALMLITGSPTTGNWIAHYLLTYLVPLGLVVVTVFILIRMFR